MNKEDVFLLLIGKMGGLKYFRFLTINRYLTLKIQIFIQLFILSTINRVCKIPREIF